MRVQEMIIGARGDVIVKVFVDNFAGASTALRTADSGRRESRR